jgi:hypothetical protein
LRLEIDVRNGGEARARLVDPDDFSAFAVVIVDDAPSTADRLAPAGIARLDEHAWVRLDALRELAGEAASPAWEASLASMLEFARPHGWVDDELGAVRGHVERRQR